MGPAVISSVGLGAARTRGNVDCVVQHPFFTGMSRFTLRPLLSLTSFRLFADGASIFCSSDDINDIETVETCEMTRVASYCVLK